MRSYHNRKYPRIVPNVPCGVERQYNTHNHQDKRKFLMYRVELKATVKSGFGNFTTTFLMYRVELKANHA